MKFTHAFACALACVLAAGAHAETRAQDCVVREMGVPTSDLDLSNEAGRHALDGRLRHAAARVCDTAHHPQAGPNWDELHCVNRALRSARLKAASLPAVEQAAAGGAGRAGR